MIRRYLRNYFHPLMFNGIPAIFQVASLLAALTPVT